LLFRERPSAAAGKGISSWWTRAFAQEVARGLVVQQFAYSDPDGDGVYTASLSVPPVAGDYEVNTLITYRESGEAKLLRLVTLVDPEGYVYEKVGDNELRISGAVVTIYVWNEAKGLFSVWPAAEFQQNNPQTVDR